MAGNAVIGALRVSLGLDSAQFESGLKRAKGSAYDFGFSVGKGLKVAANDAGRAIGDLSARTGTLGTSLAAMGVGGLAAGAALGGVVIALGETRKALAFGDDIADTANKLKISTDTLQEMRFVAHDLGGEFKDADEAFAGFQKAFGAARSGLSAKAIKPFKTLGLDPKSFATIEDAFDAVVHKVADLGNAAEQAAVVDKLGLGPLLPAIREGSAEIDRLRQAAHDLGYVMDADLVKKAGDANDKFEDLTAILDVQFKSSMVELAPVLLGLAEGLAGAAKGANELFGWLGRLSAVDLGNLARGVPVIGSALGASVEQNANAAHAKRVDARTAAQLSGVKDLLAGKPMFGDRGGTSLLPIGSTGGGKKGISGAQRAANDDDAIARAEKEELAARMALIGDISQLAALRTAEVDRETAAANRDLQRDAAEGKITAAAAQKAIALNVEAAREKKLAISQQAEADVADSIVRSREDIDRYYDQIATLQAGMANSASEAAAIEAKALAARQRTEAMRLSADMERDVIAGKRTESEAAEYKASLADLQAAERQAQAHDAAAKIAEEAAAIEQNRVSMQIDLLSSQQDLAGTDSERAEIGLRILALQQELERAKLAEVVATKGAASAEGKLAQAQLDALQEVQANQTVQAQREVFSTKLSEAGHAIANITAAFNEKTANKIAQGFDHVSQAFQTGGPIAAAMAAFSELGKAVGGSTGAFLQGFGSGGIVGGVLSVFGHKKAKKKAKKAKAAAAKKEADEKAADLAAAKRDLELQILELSGKKVEALAERRKDELAAMDPTLRALQEEKYALEDAAEAAAKAAEMTDRRSDLERELLRLTDDAAAVEADRADALKALADDPIAQKIQQQIYAVIDAQKAYSDAQDALAKAQDVADARVDQAKDLVTQSRDQLSEAYARERDELQQTREDALALADSLADLGKELRTGDLAGLDPGQQAGAARAAFNSVSARVAAGDATALADLPDAVRNFRAASLATSPTQRAANADLAAMRKTVAAGESLAKAQVSKADQQLAALNASVDGLITVNQSVVSVRDAINELTSVTAFAAAVQANASAQLEDIKASLAPALNGLSKSVNDNAPTSAAGGFDAKAISAAVDSSLSSGSSTVTDGGNTNLAADLADLLLPPLLVTARNTGDTASQLDDVINGPMTLNVVAA